MVGITEERHVLFCGAKGCGKTSLIFTMGRGFFPPEDILPGKKLSIDDITHALNCRHTNYLKGVTPFIKLRHIYCFMASHIFFNDVTYFH